MRKASHIVNEANLLQASSTKELNRDYKDNANKMLKSIIENVPNIAIQGFNKKGEIIFWNPYSEKLFGLTKRQVKGRSLNGLLLSESEKKGFKNTLKTIFGENKPAPLMEWTILPEKGEKKIVLSSVFPIALPGQESMAIAMCMDITDRKKAEAKIEESEGKYRELVGNIKIGILRATPEGDILEANPTAVEMFGYEDLDEFLELKTTDLYQTREDHENFIMEMEGNSSVKRKEFKLRTKEETSFWASIIATAIRNRSGKIIYYDTVIEDITERKKLEEKVKRLSITDELTGLYNRRHFNQTLPREIKEAESWRSSLSFIMIDIDDFKQYNDTYLHLEGDEVLKQTARVIATNIRKEEDWASRFGGDEFCIILRGRKVTEARIVAERIKKIFQNVIFKPKGKIVHKTLSVGIANCSFPERKSMRNTRNKRPSINYEKAANDLTILADKALFRAKELGKNKVVVSKKHLILK